MAKREEIENIEHGLKEGIQAKKNNDFTNQPQKRKVLASKLKMIDYQPMSYISRLHLELKTYL